MEFIYSFKEEKKHTPFLLAPISGNGSGEHLIRLKGSPRVNPSTEMKLWATRHCYRGEKTTRVLAKGCDGFFLSKRIQGPNEIRGKGFFSSSSWLLFDVTWPKDSSESPLLLSFKKYNLFYVSILLLIVGARHSFPTTSNGEPQDCALPGLLVPPPFFVNKKKNSLLVGSGMKINSLFILFRGALSFIEIVNGHHWIKKGRNVLWIFVLHNFLIN